MADEFKRHNIGDFKGRLNPDSTSKKQKRNPFSSKKKTQPQTSDVEESSSQYNPYENPFDPNSPNYHPSEDLSSSPDVSDSSHSSFPTTSEVPDPSQAFGGPELPQDPSNISSGSSPDIPLSEIGPDPSQEDGLPGKFDEDLVTGDNKRDEAVTDKSSSQERDRTQTPSKESESPYSSKESSPESEVGKKSFQGKSGTEKKEPKQESDNGAKSESKVDPKSAIRDKLTSSVAKEQQEKIKNVKRAATAIKAVGSSLVHGLITLLNSWMPILIGLAVFALIMSLMSLDQVLGPNTNACGNGVSCGVVCPSSASSGKFSDEYPENVAGSTNEEKVWAFLTSRGFTDVQAAGAMGNLSAESSFSPNALNLNDKTVAGGGTHNDWIEGKTAYGLMQWRGGRLDNLMKYVTEVSGKSPDDVDTIEGQLGFIMYEITTTNKANYDKFFSETSTTNDPKVAAERWDTIIEVSGGGTLDKRQKAADEYYKEFTGKSFSMANCGLTPGSIQELLYYALSGYIARSYSLTSRSNSYTYCDGEIPTWGNDCLMKNADGPVFFDCSSFVGWVYFQWSGGKMQLPGTTAAMATDMPKLPDWEMIVNAEGSIVANANKLMPGDLVVYREPGKAIGHVAMVLSTPSMPLAEIPSQFVPSSKSPTSVGNSWNTPYNPATDVYVIENGGGGNTLLDNSAPVPSGDQKGTGDIKPLYDLGTQMSAFRYKGSLGQ